MNPIFGNNMMPMLARICVLSKGKPVAGSPLMDVLLYHLYDESEHALEVFYRIVRAFWLFSQSDTAKQMELNLQEYPLEQMQYVIESDEALEMKVNKLKTILTSFNKNLYEAIMPKELPQGQSTDPTTKLPKLSERPLTAKAGESKREAAPRWPPSKCYILDHKSMKLRSVDLLRDPCPYQKEADQQEKERLKKSQPKPIENVKEHNSSDIYLTEYDGSILEYGLDVYKKHLQDILPIKFDDRCPYTEDEAKVIRQWYKPKQDPKSAMEDHEGTDKLGRQTYLPPISLSACLPTNGNRIQDKLGLQYKTEAHKR